MIYKICSVIFIFYCNYCISFAYANSSEISEPASTITVPTNDNTVAIKKLWAVNTTIKQAYGSTNLQPVIFSDQIITLTHKGQLHAYDKNNGNVLWKHSLNKPMKTGPVITEKWLVVTTERSQVRIYERKSLTLHWTIDIPGEVMALPKIDNDLLIIKTLNGKVITFDIENKTQRWFYEQATPLLALHKDNTPIISQEKIIIGFPDGRIVALNRDTGIILWQQFVAKPSGLTPIARLINMSAEMQIYNDKLYVLTGKNVVALSINNGEIVWQYPLISLNGFTLDDKAIYIIDTHGVLHALNCQKGTLIWQHKIPHQRQLQTPFIFQNVLTFTDNGGNVYVVSPLVGKVLTQQQITKQRLNLPILSDETTLYFLTDQGTLIAMKLEN